MKLSQDLRERNTTTDKQMGTTRLKLLAEPRQELKYALKLHIRAHSQTTGTGVTHNCTKRIKLGIHRVFQSLPPSYKNFVMNYNMQNMNKELPELFSMLKSAEIEIQKEHQVLMVNKTTSFKKQGKPKKGNIKKGGKKAAAPPEKPKGGPKPDTECYYCNGKGHWKRNCSKYLADLKSGLVKKKKGISDIHVIDVYLTGSRTSVWSAAEWHQHDGNSERRDCPVHVPGKEVRAERDG
nr:uncharacterized protein LOC127315754 [Lolium perenne]